MKGKGKKVQHLDVNLHLHVRLDLHRIRIFTSIFIDVITSISISKASMTTARHAGFTRQGEAMQGKYDVGTACRIYRARQGKTGQV